MTRVSTRFPSVFAGLALLCCGVLCAAAVPVTHLAAPAGLLAWFVAPFGLAVVVLLVLAGLGMLPDAMYTDRPILAGGMAAWAVGLLIWWSASDGSGHGALLALLAGGFCGIGAAAVLASWLARMPEYGTAEFASLTCAPVAVGALLAIPAFIVPAASLPCALAAGLGSGALGLAVPSLKNIPRGSVARVAKQAGFFAKTAACVALWAASLSYSMRHFFPMVLMAPAWLPMVATAGMAVVLWAVALIGSRIGKNAGKTTGKDIGKITGKVAVAAAPVRPFPAIQAYPIVLAAGIVPLEYLGTMAPLLQPLCLAGLFGATVALYAFLAWDCASASGTNPLFCLGVVFGAALVGTVVAFWCEGLVGMRTDTVFWAVAPLVCLVAAIVACDFLLTPASLAKRLTASDDEASGAFVATRLGLQCRAVARAHDLTSREVEVLDLLVQGYSLAYVCEKLVIAQGTATTHKQRIYKKLGVHTKNELIELVSTTDIDDA